MSDILPIVDAVVFYGLAGLALAAAIGVIAQRNPTHSAFFLIVVLCALSGVYGLLGSPFIAVLQVVVYAGAIMVLFLFVLMLLNVRAEPERSGRTLAGAALGLVVLLVLQVGMVLVKLDLHAAPGYDASTARMARELFSPQYLYVFEATSVLILAALVGAVALAKRDP